MEGATSNFSGLFGQEQEGGTCSRTFPSSLEFWNTGNRSTLLTAGGPTRYFSLTRVLTPNIYVFGDGRKLKPSVNP